MMKRFGPPWNENMAELEEVPIPLGERCGWCKEPIEANHFGVLMPFLSEAVEWSEIPYHYECQLRQVLGPVNYLRGTCKHRGGTAPCEPPELSRREGAIAAVYYVEGQGSR